MPKGLRLEDFRLEDYSGLKYASPFPTLTDLEMFTALRKAGPLARVRGLHHLLSLNNPLL